MCAYLENISTKKEVLRKVLYYIACIDKGKKYVLFRQSSNLLVCSFPHTFNSIPVSKAT